MSKNNTAAYVSTGKPKVGGAIFSAPVGTALPTDATTALNEAFVCMGYASQDGLVNGYGSESSETAAWGGDIVDTSKTKQSDTWKYTAIEALNINVLKGVYGDENVSGDLKTGITIKATAAQAEPRAYVFDMVLKGGALKRVVLPNASFAGIEDVTYKDDTQIGYAITLSALPDSTGTTHYEYIIDPKAAA